MAGLSLASGAFEDGAEIPRKHGYKHGNASPPLVIRGAPEGCASLALVMDDPDAVGAVGRVWVHWVLWNIPPGSAGIDECAQPEGSVEGTTDFGEAGYGGPAPPDRRHTYVFRLYALDAVLDLERGSTRRQLEESMRGHVTAKAELRGTFAP